MTPKFTIRTLFVFVAICAVCALMVRTSDWIASVGLGMSVIILMFAIHFTTEFLGTGSNRGIRGLAFLLAGVIGWFSIVDYSVWFSWCPQCSDHHRIGEYRICGIPVCSRRSNIHVDSVSQLRSDLGMSCEHRFECEHLVRAWGLVYYARPCIGITCCLSGYLDCYNEDVSLRVRQFAAENPEDAIELGKQVVDKQDYAAMHAFIAKMKAGKTEAYDPSRGTASEPTDEHGQ